MPEEMLENMEYWILNLERTLGRLPMNMNWSVNVLQIVTYVLTALGLYAMANRRGLRHAWLSWIPIGNLWVIGCLSDQFRYVVRGENKKKRKTLVRLVVAEILAVILLIALLIGCIFFAAQAYVDDSDALVPGILGFGGGFLVLVLAIAGMGIAVAIIRFMALYDVYQSGDPEHAVLFLVLSIFIRVTEPFFLFCNRKKDAGMVQRAPRNYGGYAGSQNAQGYQAPGSQNYQVYGCHQSSDDNRYSGDSGNQQ